MILSKNKVKLNYNFLDMKEEIKRRSKQFAIAIIKMTESLPRKNSTL